MRLAPVPLFFANDPEVVIAHAGDSSRTTHGAREATDACRYMAGLIIGALQDRSKTDVLAPLFTPVAGLWDREPLAPNIHDIAAGSFLRREPPDIRGAGYVVDSLEAALWAFAKSTSFEHCALLAVNLGDDGIRPGPCMVRSRARSMALTLSPSDGARSWRVWRRSRVVRCG